MIVRPASPAALGRVARKGFTLIEVVAVTAIMMVLIGLAAFAVTSQLERAKVNEAYIKMGKIEQAAKQYYIEAGSVWPTSVQELVQPTAGGAPLLEGGALAATDPWGGQFQISPQQDEAGTERLVVTCVNPKTGQTLTWPKQ